MCVHREEKSNELSVFVGDIGPEVNDELLLVTFQSRYISIQSARVVMDPLTGMSKGYGFVRFGDENEQQRAMVEMQGAYCGSRPIRISVAVPKTKLNATNLNNFQHTPNYTNQRQFNDPSNTNVFVGGLPPTTNDDELRSCFQRFGDIVLVKIPPGRGCGFVQFVHRHSAELAISQMNGSSIGNSRVRVSWGRPQTDRQPTNSFRSSLPTPVPSTPMDPLAPIHIETTNSSFINSKEDSIESFTREISSTDNIRVL
ncbi:hypothetical protein K7432_000393 [Basidiobolus ranarum]|uniref:RRM domain-containing protein n=1 Tax=Basidiobolus ranarum TaxID=34480 RepID=A0ABR2WBB1_9FUNG